MLKRATLAELRDALILLCERYPEIADRNVIVSTDSGYAGAHITSPIRLYEYVGGREDINIYSNDDLDLEHSKNIVCYSME
jgi:hypothetical protein